MPRDGGGVRGRGRARRRGGGRARRAAARLIGSVVAGHRIARLVGRGGMGVVYEAVEEALGRTVALKLVAPERAGEPGFRERFIAESRLAASIDHPNVLPVFKARRGGRAAVPGDAASSTAPTCARSRRCTRRARRAIVAQVGAALDAAHARRLVHRDVKPANVLVTRRRPRVPDRLRPRQGARRERRPHAHGRRSSARSTTSRPSASAARATGPPPTCTRSAACSTTRSPGAVPFPLEGTERKLWAHLSEPPPRLGSPASTP